MNITINKAKASILRQKKIYLALIILVIIGIICGAVFTTIITDIDKNLVKEQLSQFFNQIKISNINYNKAIVNSIASNLIYSFGIWLLGISIIGLPLIIFFLFMKGFIVGFAGSSIISFYGLKGIIGAFTYIFPHHLISLAISILLSFYAISFSNKLFSYLFLKKEINFKHVMHRYIKILIISIIGLLLCSLFEVYLSPFLIKFFTNMI